MCPRSLTTALVVLGIGLPARAQGPPAQPDREKAVAAIEKVGGRVSRDESAPGKPVKGAHFYSWSARSLRDADLDVLAGLPHLEEVFVQGEDITNAGLKHLRPLRQLRSLALDQGKITGEGLAELKGMTQLRELRLSALPLNDEGLTHLRGMVELRQLSLDHTPITDEGLKHLEGLKQLRAVSLSNTKVTEVGVARLKAALPYLIVQGLLQEDDRPEQRSVWLPFLTVVGLVVVGGLAAWLLLRRWRPGFLSPAREWRLAVVVALVVASSATVLAMAPRRGPTEEGDAGTFWLLACRVDVGAKDTSLWGGHYLPRDGWFFYYLPHIHGQHLYRVRDADAEALFPEVVRKLEGAPAGFLPPDVETGFQTWRQVDGTQDAATLVREIWKASLVQARQQGPTAYANALAEESAFAERWQRCRRYWLSGAFEVIFYAGLLLFGAWPWVVGARTVWWAAHLGLAPFLFCVPYWLGYVPLAFSSAGPGGGVLYPGLLEVFHGLPWTGVDTAVLRNVPRLLEPLAQYPGPGSISFRGGVGPVAVTVLSLVVALLVLVVREVLTRHDPLAVAVPPPARFDRACVA